jgi:hypothetical protein
MGNSRRRRPKKIEVSPILAGFWEDQIRSFGRSVHFIDTQGILECWEKDSLVNEHLERSIGVTFLTSTYVLAEAVRRLVKAQLQNQHKGPGGERGKDLAVHLLTDWLTLHDVRTICPPLEAFEYATKVYTSEYRALGCDLCDVISFVIVKGMEQDAIISTDSHFASMGLVLLP